MTDLARRIRMDKFLKVLALASVVVCVGCSDGEEITGTEPPVDDVIRVPADQPTIQAAIDAANGGDTILVADGYYGGPGNQDIRFSGKWVILMSENGPANTVIGVEADSLDQHLAFELSMTGESDVVIDGFTICGGFNSQGSALYLKSVSPTIKNCIFVANTALTSGGAIRCKNASPIFTNCTFYGNIAPTGSIMYLLAGSSPRFNNCILASSKGGEVVVCADNLCLPTFSCTNIYDNEGGDWLECIEEYLGSDGNISLDPLFCFAGEQDFHLQSSSPCTAENSECGETIGALSGDCSQ